MVVHLQKRMRHKSEPAKWKSTAKPSGATKRVLTGTDSAGTWTTVQANQWCPPQSHIYPDEVNKRWLLSFPGRVMSRSWGAHGFEESCRMCLRATRKRDKEGLVYPRCNATQLSVEVEHEEGILGLLLLHSTRHSEAKLHKQGNARLQQTSAEDN
eukprot:5140641-Amphidinium_carterae.1